MLPAREVEPRRYVVGTHPQGVCEILAGTWIIQLFQRKPVRIQRLGSRRGLQQRRSHGRRVLQVPRVAREIHAHELPIPRGVGCRMERGVQNGPRSRNSTELRFAHCCQEQALPGRRLVSTENLERLLRSPVREESTCRI